LPPTTRPRWANSSEARASQIEGTILTETGDYRYLAGEVDADGNLRLSTFDGSHAFLLHLRIDGQDRLRGDFWSGAAFHDTLNGQRNDQAELADGFHQVRVISPTGWQELEFPDLRGQVTRLAHQPFAPVTILHIFGSWCPNCHDAARLFAELHQKYSDRGLQIVGLAFEQTGDPPTDAAQVQWYIDRHVVTYKILLAGVADKQAASRQLPFLDRLRAFPTTVFIDGTGQIFAVYSGFSGPATGRQAAVLAKQFEALIVEQLAKNDKQTEGR
jgi:thiol-disulfide isomerase/thioredoxin